MGEELEKFLGALVTQTVRSVYQRELDEEFDEHPSEHLGRQIGHAVGRTIAAILDPFGSDQVG
ncbi:hypothetical protein [Chlorogloeopsis sp. ULAP02]|uniref:hypothetical protein n=1 Tax=Chlorogloeopsis sp. ULAP02 TaxID=3107926 RepID=UPI003136832D